MNISKTLLAGVIILSLISNQVYAAPGGNGKGKGGGNGKAKGKTEEKSNNGNKGNGQSNKSSNAKSSNGRKQSVNTPAATRRTSTSTKASSTKRRNKIKNSKRQAKVRANRPEAGKRGKSADHRKTKLNHNDKFAGLTGKAKWMYNPHDERGQGNNGKPKMRDPYGHDKDSGREKSERGRPIREILLNLAEAISVNFAIVDGYLQQLRSWVETYLRLAQQYPQVTWYAYYATYLQNYITNYISRYTFDKIAVNRSDTIDYNIGFTPPEGFEGTNLLVTTSITSVSDYNYNLYNWTYDPTTGTWQRTLNAIDYDAGEVIFEQTQEVALSADNTFNYSYDLPATLAGYTGFYANLNVTVTEPDSGQTVTVAYDRQLYLYRCPYGKVTNAKSNKPIVGAKVTVHFEDGSIVPLDKASNPTASNPQITDATGRYGFKLQTNRKYFIKASAPGYKDYKSPTFTEKWHVLREDIKLDPVDQVALNVK